MSKVTVDEIKQFGLQDSDINELIYQRIVKPLDNGLYELFRVQDLLDYGKSLICQNHYDKARYLFLHFSQIDPVNYDICFCLFLINIHDRKYEEALTYFDTFFSNVNFVIDTDNNFYLFMLSMIGVLREEYRDYTINLDMLDIRANLKDNKYQNPFHLNKVRDFVFVQKFNSASKELEEYIKEKGSLDIRDILARELISQASDAQFRDKSNLLVLIKQKNYQEVRDYYWELRKMHRLSVFDNYCLLLTEKLLEMMRSRRVLPKMICDTDNVYEAIDKNNFDLALSIVKTNKRSISNDMFYLLLSEINDKIYEFKEAKEVSRADTYDMPELKDIFRLFDDNQLDKAYKKLEEYLDSLGILEYLFIIKGLIKVSLFDKSGYDRVIDIIKQISKGSYSFNLASFIESFYDCIVKNKFIEASMYLDIIESAKEIGYECAFLDELHKILDRCDGGLELKIFVDEMNKKLIKQRGIILLEAMDDEKINRILEVAKNYSNMVAFVIGDREKRVVLRYRNRQFGYVDVKELINLGLKDYNEGNFDGCIEKNFLLLQYFVCPKAVLYARLGMAFLKKRFLEEAIDYLEVATDLAKKENLRYDYTGLIANIKKDIVARDNVSNKSRKKV